MEQFDTKAVGQAEDMRAKLKSSTFVKESKSRQRNAWGGGNTVSNQPGSKQALTIYKRSIP